MLSFLSSKRLSLILLSCLVIVFLFGRIVNIYNSLWLFIPLTLFFLNITFCTITRIVRDHRVTLSSSGSYILHLSFLIILIGVVLGKTTGFDGYARIIEGSMFQEDKRDYLRLREGPFFNKKHLGFLVKMKDFFILYKGKWVTDSGCELVVFEKNREVKRKRIKVNYPLHYKGIKLILIDFGIAPLFTLTSKEKVESWSYVPFHRAGGDTLGFRASFHIGNTDLLCNAYLYPEATVSEKEIKPISLLPENPVLRYKIKKDRQIIAQGILPYKHSRDIGGKVLNFKGLRYWAGFEVKRDIGAPILYIGMFAGILGLILKVCSSRLFLRE